MAKYPGTRQTAGFHDLGSVQKASIIAAFLVMAGCGCPAAADPTQDMIDRYKASLATQQAAPGPEIPSAPALVEAAHAAVLAMLKDPESSRWGYLRFFQAPTAGQVQACGQINSKNSYGGYAGLVPFFVVLEPTAGGGWRTKDADISRQNREGLFYSAHPSCNPSAW